MQRSGLVDEPPPDPHASSSKSHVKSRDQESNGRDSSLNSHGLASHTSTWEKPAEEVFVAGTFDDWQKTVQLENREGFFHREVTLPRVDTFYNFVVDGRCTVNPMGRLENDANGSVNNLLLPQDFGDGHRWETIRAKAAKRAAQLATGLHDQDHEELKGSASGDEDIKKRVARIKARVAELTRDSNMPSAHTSADIRSEGLLIRAERPAPPEPSIDVGIAKGFPQQLVIRQGNFLVDDFSMCKPRENKSTKNSDTREVVLGIQLPPTYRDVLMPSGANTTPPDSSSDGEERGRNIGDLRELQEALQHMSIQRVPSTTGQRVATEDSTNARKLESMSSNALDYILSSIGDPSASEAFQRHEISNLWLPLSKQTLRRLCTNGPSERRFMELQEEVMDFEVDSMPKVYLERTESRTHFCIADDEALIEEHRVLGEGACGIVEEVSFWTGQRRARCVRKRIGRPRLIRAQKKIMDAFAREIGVMRQVDHQHCVRFLASYTDFDHVNILSLPVADMDLATFLDRPVQEAERRILYRGFGCLSSAINYLHKRNIRHEDLKPQNVLIHGENILLTDFGFSLDFSDDAASTTTGNPSAWTIRYSAPEVLNCEPRNRSTDIWSLGCIFLEMVSGFHGIQLSDLKERWKRTGNGQASFARNSEALEAWFGEILKDFDDAKATPVMRRLCALTRVMLSNIPTHRPSAQHVVDNISDMAHLTNENSEQYGTTCRGPVPCTGLSRPAILMDAATLQVTGTQKFHYLDEYLHPWCYARWSHQFRDLDWNELPMHKGDRESDWCKSISDGKYFESKSDWRQFVSDSIEKIHAAGAKICREARRTGSTEAFSSEGLTSTEGKAHAFSSAFLLNLKNVVFTRLFLRPGTTKSDTEGSARSVQLTLIPICHSRSPFYGKFFWMLSWCKDHHDKEDVEYECIDLTEMI